MMLIRREEASKLQRIDSDCFTNGPNQSLVSPESKPILACNRNEETKPDRKGLTADREADHAALVYELCMSAPGSSHIIDAANQDFLRRGALSWLRDDWRTDCQFIYFFFEMRTKSATDFRAAAATSFS